MRKLLGELEEQVMQIMWQGETWLKPGEVQTLLGKDLAYTTIMTILQRLYSKDFLKRRKQKGICYYQARMSKQDYVHHNLADLFSGVLSSYGNLAISQFIDTVKTNPNNLKQLNDYLDAHPHE
jgi:predicted transcriptional regulator